MTIPFDEAAPQLLEDFAALTDVVLRTRSEPSGGLFIAEGAITIERAFCSGARPRAVLCEEKWLDSLPSFAKDVPIIVGTQSELRSVTGYIVHRGALASFHRPLALDHSALIRDSHTLLILEGLVNHTNVGAIIRSAAAFGVDGILLDTHCADPLYRRAIRTSMGTVFNMKWARFTDHLDLAERLAESKYDVLALTPLPSARSIRSWRPGERSALILGTEGDGLSTDAHGIASQELRIPMAAGIDSLNVSAAAAVALYEFTNHVHS
ncbi:unannotated protein [freshwater metagenome]|uniref:Unannotated protein n=1 Tax=freshwater metagenome TaxID=449393 RepID=A0A6J7S5B9_9ZZZZ|nr:rRNA methyltransferase [Actinomycetota bacterium]MSY26762.1 rRNA methyltransferase [Actinomycetota bacterium]MTB13759.1 rRNA methyltransferase [Actinomycetota bacterium]MTB24662.1 rRNA methyltransferase [Actinomycetota bacterium]